MKAIDSSAIDLLERSIIRPRRRLVPEILLGRSPEVREKLDAVFHQTVKSARQPSTEKTPAVELYGGVFFTAMAVLLFEVALTRVFAVLMWYHFAYMVISLALLGFGAAGSFLTWFRIAERREQMWGRLGAFSTLFGLAVIGSFFVVTSIHVDSVEIWRDPKNLLGLLTYLGILSVPFLCGGLAIGASLSWFPKKVGSVYFVDLVGSAVGALSAPFLLDHFETGVVIMISATMALVGAVVFSLRSARLPWRALSVAGVLSALILAVALNGGGAGIPELSWRVPFAPQKVFPKFFFEGGRSEKTLPSAVAQIDISRELNRPLFMAADFGVRGTERFPIRGVTQDGTAPTALYRDAGKIERFTSLASSQAATSFIAQGESAGTPPEVLVIGVGGGPDIMLALYHGASKVTAVELNQAMVRMVTKDYADYIGHLFDDPRIDLINEEGRAFLKHSDQRFDVIQLSGVDTYTALSTGAYTVSENYLYTVDALRDMYRHLKDGGYVNYSRFILTRPPRRPRESLRLANIARQALVEEGVAEPSLQIAVFQGDLWASTILKKGPFEEGEIAALEEFAAREQFFGFAFNPLRREEDGYNASVGNLYRKRAAKIVPGDLGVRPDAETSEALLAALQSASGGDSEASDASLALAAAGLGLPEHDPQELLAALAENRDAEVAYIKSYVDGRIELQKNFETLMKGSEAERQALIGSYPHDLRPTTDDEPFFFNYYRFSDLFSLEKFNIPGWYEALPEFPVGHAVLLASLVQIVILATLLILGPLRPLKRTGHSLKSMSRFFVYFAALGCGFMFLEISLMQKLILFLGHPTYSLSVVLATLLAFTGLGALVSSRITAVTRHVMFGLLGAVFCLVLFDGFVIDGVLNTLMGLGIHYRIAVAILLLAPTGFVLGFPFPLGIRLLERRSAVLIPWGWAVNGFLSVFGSMMSIVLAMTFGFTDVMVTAGLLYAVGFLLVPTEEDAPQATAVAVS